MSDNLKKAEEVILKEKMLKREEWTNKFNTFIEEMENEGVYLDISMNLTVRGCEPNINLVVR